MEEAKAVEEAMRRAAMERALRGEVEKKHRHEGPEHHIHQHGERHGHPNLMFAPVDIEKLEEEAAFSNQVVASAQTAQSPYRNWTIEVAPSLIKSPNVAKRAAYFYYLPLRLEEKRERLAL